MDRQKDKKTDSQTDRWIVRILDSMLSGKFHNKKKCWHIDKKALFWQGKKKEFFYFEYWETAFRLGFLSSTNGCQLPVLHVFLAHSTCLLCSLMTVINLIMGRSFRRTNHVIAAFQRGNQWMLLNLTLSSSLIDCELILAKQR